MADARSWFTYYYWNDDRRAPDFARTVEIHRKPGYDPVELFLDPEISSPKLAIGKRLLLRKLGFRALMDVIPLDAALVGAHTAASPTTPRTVRWSSPTVVTCSIGAHCGDRHQALLLDAVFLSRP